MVGDSRLASLIPRRGLTRTDVSVPREVASNATSQTLLSECAEAGRLGTMQIDVNADLGEGVTDDEGLLGVVTSANLACGFHAGDEDTMRWVCEAAEARGVVVGAQVSYRDRENFGRKHMDVAADVLTEWVREQVELLDAIASSCGIEVAYLKPHGALYNRVVDDEDQAAAVLEGSGSLPVLGLPGSAILRLAGSAGRTGVREGFPDRGYTADGRLVPRDQPGALVEGKDAIAANAVDMARAGEVASLCVHGDSPGAVEAAAAVRLGLVDAGYDVRPWWSPDS
jgi:5-oxoprolinase (ATP-hydrolysing) subunit A